MKFSFPLAIQIQTISQRPPVLVTEALYRNENHYPKLNWKVKAKERSSSFTFRLIHSLRKETRSVSYHVMREIDFYVRNLLAQFKVAFYVLKAHLYGFINL